MSQTGSFAGGIFPPGSVVETITGNIGGIVPPDALNNINIIGGGPVVVTGDIALSTLTITVNAATNIAAGIVRLSTNAETIAGALGTVAVVPSSLAAKLGVQTSHGIAYGEGPAATISWTAEGATGQIFTGMTGAAPTWTLAGTTGQLFAGRTGNTPIWTAIGTTGQLLAANTGTVPSWIAAGTSGQVLTANAGVNPSFENIGTRSGLTLHGVVLAENLGAFVATAAGTSGQLLQSKGAAADPDWTTTLYPSTTAVGDVLYGSAANTLAELPFVATATRYLANTGGGATIPAWDQVNMANGVTGVLTVPNGGTGANTLTLHGLLLGNTTGAIQALAEATNGQIPIGSTGANPVLATLTAGTGVTITNAAGSITISAGGVPQQQIYYVGKHGNDANAGTTIETAVLTFGQAITLATAATPGPANRFAIVCLDDGIYAEAITVPQYVDVFAPNATLTGTIVVSDDISVKFSRLNVATATIGVSKGAGTAYANVEIDYIVCADTGIGFLCTAGYLNCRWKEMYVANGFGVGDLSSAELHMHVYGGDIYITGTGYGIARANAGYTLGHVDHITKTGAGTGTAVAVFAGTIAVNVNDIDCTAAYDVNGATSVLRLFANEISGTRTVAAGGTAKVWVPPTVMTDGQLVIGSTGVDPVVGSLASAGSTIAITPGAGTINLETGAAVATSYLTDDTNSAVPAVGVLTVAGGNNISTSSAASTVTVAVTGTTQHCVQVGSAAGALTSLAAATNGQLVIGSTGVAPVVATLTAGSGIAIANGAGSINISADNAGFEWTVVTLAQTAADNQGYFCNNAGGVTVTLPASSAIGDTFSVAAMDAGGWTVAQLAGQQIQVGNVATTAGVGGSLASSAIGDWVTLVCNVANTNWMCRVEQGNITVV